ncbi:DNA photolyase [Pelagibacterales bacterium SAG-MED15]|nr:DNA photolyase [Pelagibacterales bacterium SAG-MED15]
MNFLPSRSAAIEQLERFIENNLNQYAKLRNFDYGSKKRNNISCLSPYISHGIINEIEVIDKSLKKFSFSKNEKFIQEVLWRVYWKGWLELRPTVWKDYLSDLEKIKKDYSNDQDYKNAINGGTNLKCFDEWVKELKENNYLHNHARMWFASIWIFTLKLPWQLGAEFFLQHLFDGDAASNTLGWRWVAGVQTKGKNYIAKEWNIKLFSYNRFQNVKLNEDAQPIFDNRTYSIETKNFENMQDIKNKNLIIFDNNLSFETSDFKDNKFNKVFLVSNKNENRKIKLSQKNIEFKGNLFEDQKKRLLEKSIDCEIIDIRDLDTMNDNLLCLYPSVGENLDFINSNKLKNISFLYRKIDQYSWKYCNKGFFNFKNHIPKIVQEFI